MGQKNTLPAWALPLYKQARKNAEKRGIHFALTEQEMTDMVDRADGACEITGIPFVLRSSGENKRRPFAPSLDRKDSSLGYEHANCRLVCVAANLAMNEWGERVLREIAYAMRPASGIADVAAEINDLRAERDDLSKELAMLREKYADLEGRYLDIKIRTKGIDLPFVLPVHRIK